MTPAESAPAAAQVLFLGEQAIVASATGTMSGSLLLATLLIGLTLAGAAFMHFHKDGLTTRKPFYKGGFLKSKNVDEATESGMLGEYLLIKS